MFGKGKEIKKLPNSKDILMHVSDLEIFEFYLGGLPRTSIKSPLREDNKPSFNLFMSNDHGKVFFKDFATNESGDCFLFVMRLFKLKSKSETFIKIARDFGLNQFETDSISFGPSPTINNAKLKRNVKKIKSERSKFNIKVRPWNLVDKMYWNNKYCLTRKQLEYCDVFPISHFFMNSICVEAQNLAYAFGEKKDGVQTFKIYQPNANHENKWFSNNDYSTWELWTQLPESGDSLIITSSRKDAMVIKSLFGTSNITSCSLQSERVKPKENVINQLKKRFKKVFILYDNDYGKVENVGRIEGHKLSQSTGFTQIEIPDKFGVKDPSDFIEKFGPKSLTKLLLSLVNKK